MKAMPRGKAPDAPVLPDWLAECNGWVGGEVYSTAWVALVPDPADRHRPAWPASLAYLRRSQLEDGGWGANEVYFAHERTVATLAAVQALSHWREDPEDALRVTRGLKALQRYAADLPDERRPTMGFDLIFPCLRRRVAPLLGDLDAQLWPPVDVIQQLVQAAIHSDALDPAQPGGWWWFLEIMPEQRLAELDDSILNRYGGIQVSPAATAAFLAAKRRAGQDSPPAAAYLHSLLAHGNGSVPSVWPSETSDQIWGAFALSLAGVDPGLPNVAPLVDAIAETWQQQPTGLGNAAVIPVNDGDDTFLGYAVLDWAGLTPHSDHPALQFWDAEGYFRSFNEEPARIPSVNLHALIALRRQPGFPHHDKAERVADWLIGQLDAACPFVDQYHLSPYYPMTRAIHAFAGWRDRAARLCVDFVLRHQRRDGGWGWFERSTREETAYCVLALAAARSYGLLTDDAPLRAAAAYLDSVAADRPFERLWIAKSLYCLTGSVKASIYAARTVLQELASEVYADV